MMISFSHHLKFFTDTLQTRQLSRLKENCGLNAILSKMRNRVNRAVQLIEQCNINSVKNDYKNQGLNLNAWPTHANYSEVFDERDTKQQQVLLFSDFEVSDTVFCILALHKIHVQSFFDFGTQRFLSKVHLELIHFVKETWLNLVDRQSRCKIQSPRKFTISLG